MEDPRGIRYDHRTIEEKWQHVWVETRLYVVDTEAVKKPFYNLMMFPYPSAEGLHVGNMYAFTGSDIYGRFKQMQGYDVFEPIGLDGFGIHSENFALKIGRHPMDHAQITQKRFYDQLHKIGAMFDFTKTVETYDPLYYRWTQWLFIQLFKAGLAYRAKAEVNFCPSCKTVLADEQIIDGACERCGNIVEKKALEQWFFRITAYAEKLLGNIPKLDWAEVVKTAQTNWIGKKEGAVISYPVVTENGEEVGEISCFTTRPDTNFGATFVVLAPEHGFVGRIISYFSPSDVLTSLSNDPSLLVNRPHTNLIQDKIEVGKQRTRLRALDGDPQIRNNPSLVKKIQEYVDAAKQKSAIERTAEGKKKTGVFTGLYCINRLNHKKMPLYISDFVLVGFGTGAVVGVPGHDKRDFQFAQTFDLPVLRVVVGEDGDTSPIIKEEQVWEGMGSMMNSQFLDGLATDAAIVAMVEYLQKQGWGESKTTYHLRDWLISRQRYWGPPIPMIYCKHCASEGRSWGDDQQSAVSHQLSDGKCVDIAAWNAAGWFPVPEDQLPVVLPRIEDYKPSDDGIAPLSKHKEFFDTVCPCCGKPAVRETDVSDTFLDSSWYFLRYPSVRETKGGKGTVGSKTYSEDLPFDQVITKKWLPVSMYTGGSEHSVMHLLYSRYITMVLHDLGHLDFEEPFTRFFAHGLVIKDGAKMSKSKGNVVNPDEYIAKYGADALRLYLMFMGPFSLGGDFRDTGMEGMYRWIGRVWRIIINSLNSHQSRTFSLPTSSSCAPISPQSESFDHMNTVVSEKQDVGGNIQDCGRSKGAPLSATLQSTLHLLDKTIAKLTGDIENRRYNTAIACLMEFTNAVQDKGGVLEKEMLKKFILLLAPFAPYIAEEAWNLVNGRELYTDPNHSVHRQPWPSYDPKHLQDKDVTIVVQVNGKVRDTLIVPAMQGTKQDVVEIQARKSAKVSPYLKAGTVKTVIFVPGKLLNFVV